MAIWKLRLCHVDVWSRTQIVVTRCLMEIKSMALIAKIEVNFMERTYKQS